MIRVLVVEPGKAPYKKKISGELKSMQDLVGGPIQVVYPFEQPIALICNDEGKLQGLPYNRALRDADSWEIYDAVAGTFFLCGAPGGSEEFTSLSDEQVEMCRKQFAVPELFIDLGDSLLVLPMLDVCQ